MTDSDAPVIAPETVARLMLTLRWESDGVLFEDRRFLDKVRFDLDIFPPGLWEALQGRRPGESVRLDFGPEALAGRPDDKLRARIPRDAFDGEFIPGRRLVPALGRFYPQGVLHRAMPGVFKANARPFRITEAEPHLLGVDLNPPFAGRAASLEARVVEVVGRAGAMGGRCHDLAAMLTEGPGMQARLPGGRPTDFLPAEGLSRAEEGDDAAFYARPRMVVHLDSRALAEVTALYGRFLEPGMRVLDLMSSRHSHLPPGLDPGRVVGLGLNAGELAANPRLDSPVVHDLNAEPRLPFGDGAFDACICTVSVEYLTRPLAVFADLVRVLKPGAPLVVTFSHRWFPPKVVDLWVELHPFERPGLVLEYFHRAGGFTDLGASSLRGLPRPADDPYSAREPESDPVFAVWGRRA